MITLPVIELVLEAFLLGIIVNCFARYNATADFLNMLLVVGGVLIGGILIEWQLADLIGLWTLPFHVLLIVVLLIVITGTNPVQAAIITAVFFVVKIGLHFAFGALGGES